MPGLPVVLPAGRSHSTRERYFNRMYTPCDPDQLDASIRTEVRNGATWIKIITDFPLVVDGVPSGPKAATYDERDTPSAPWPPLTTLAPRVAAHSTIPASHLVAMGVDSIEHGNGLTEDDLVTLGARGGAWTPTVGAVLARRPRPRHVPTSTSW